LAIMQSAVERRQVVSPRLLTEPAILLSSCRRFHHQDHVTACRGWNRLMRWSQGPERKPETLVGALLSVACQATPCFRRVVGGGGESCMGNRKLNGGGTGPQYGNRASRTQGWTMGVSIIVLNLKGAVLAAGKCWRWGWRLRRWVAGCWLDDVVVSLTGATSCQERTWHGVVVPVRKALGPRGTSRRHTGSKALHPKNGLESRHRHHSVGHCSIIKSNVTRASPTTISITIPSQLTPACGWPPCPTV
jgi:hypothetical protein